MEYQYEIRQDEADREVLEFIFASYKITTELNKFNSFPLEWKITTSSKLSTMQSSEFKYMVNVAEQRVITKDGSYLVRILENDEIGTDEEKVFREIGFDTYFRERHSALDLQQFTRTAMDLPGICIEYWPDVAKIDYEDEGYLNALRELYQVEYKADFKVRASGRWDMFAPDPNEFVKRFVSGDAKDDCMFVAKIDKKIVGLTYPWIEDKKTAGIFFTGTIPEHTGKHIATALKIKMANLLKNKGFLSLITNNRVDNPAILKTNDALGFEITHDRLFLRKQLTS